LLDAFKDFSEGVLGKGVVRCKDTTGFIANRIGCFAMQQVMWLTLEEGLGFDEVDAMTGQAIGRPKSATFRLCDLVGVDLMVQVGKNFAGELAHDEQAAVFKLPGFIEEMVKRGWWGDKKGQGFYKKIKSDKGTEFLTLDPKTFEYRPRCEAQFASLAAASRLADPAERMRSLCAAGDKAGAFVWKHLSALICYAANRVPEIADDIVTIDHAMKWGYNYELGPFETWDRWACAKPPRAWGRKAAKCPGLCANCSRPAGLPFTRDARPGGSTSTCPERFPARAHGGQGHQPAAAAQGR